MKTPLITLLALALTYAAGQLTATAANYLDVTTQQGTEATLAKTIPGLFQGQSGGNGRFLLTYTSLFHPNNVGGYFCCVSIGIRIGIHIYGPFAGYVVIHSYGPNHWTTNYVADPDSVAYGDHSSIGYPY